MVGVRPPLFILKVLKYSCTISGVLDCHHLRRIADNEVHGCCRATETFEKGHRLIPVLLLQYVSDNVWHRHAVHIPLRRWNNIHRHAEILVVHAVLGQ